MKWNIQLKLNLIWDIFFSVSVACFMKYFRNLQPTCPIRFRLKCNKHNIFSFFFLFFDKSTKQNIKFPQYFKYYYNMNVVVKRKRDFFGRKNLDDTVVAELLQEWNGFGFYSSLKNSKARCFRSVSTLLYKSNVMYKKTNIKSN